MWRALGAIIERDLKRMLRQRGRLVSAMVRPLIWLLIIGGGMQTMVEHGNPGLRYKEFMVPGLLCMVLLFGSLLASLSMVYDKEGGVMRMLLMAPFPRYWIILARTLGATLVGLTQALMLMLILGVLGYLHAPASVALLAAGLAVTALVCASLGMLIAVYSKSYEDFAVIMNFFIFPTFFLSGALYPVQQLPLVLKTIALANPFSYGVDLIKHALLPHLAGPLGSDFSAALDLGVMLGFIAVALVIACLRFSQTPVIEAFAQVLNRPRPR